ncbi:MAG: hypothetical protein HY813_01900 [Candidatus Portnoybacteria bacterium]|nr:hypothetical protein [Candidatus Portnoybacteria bacterium]
MENGIWVLPSKPSYEKGIPHTAYAGVAIGGLPDVDISLAMACMSALVARGIGENRCPTDSERVNLCIGGAIIKTLSGKTIASSNKKYFLTLNTHVSEVLWEAIWKATHLSEPRFRLNETILVVIWHLFIPRKHYAPPERPYYLSWFEGWWENFRYADDLFSNVCNVRLECLKDGEKEFESLSEDIQSAISEISKHVPEMLKMIINDQ